MIARIWHGWTSPENADAYEEVLYKKVIPGIEAKNIEGFQKIEVLRQEHQNEMEFVTIMYFEDLNAVKDFMGGDYKVAHVPAAAQKLLKRYDKRSEHYQLRKEQKY